MNFKEFVGESFSDSGDKAEFSITDFDNDDARGLATNMEKKYHIRMTFEGSDGSGKNKVANYSSTMTTNTANLIKKSYKADFPQITYVRWRGW